MKICSLHLVVWDIAIKKTLSRIYDSSNKSKYIVLSFCLKIFQQNQTVLRPLDRPNFIQMLKSPVIHKKPSNVDIEIII